MKAIRNARVVFGEELLSDGAVLYEDGTIYYAGPDKDLDYGNAEVMDAGGAILGPGFVDIHCHAGGSVWAYEDPIGMARAHLAGGTTSLLCTLYHDIPQERLFACAKEIRRAMAASLPGNIVGIHMEGPYLSNKYGAHAHTARKANPVEYERYLAAFGDLVLQWTYSPEVEGTERFAKRVREAGIVLSIGHSEADAKMVFEAVRCGATICTHITDATGTSPEPSGYAGTKEVSFDQAAMLCDELYCELINDSLGAHVRPLMSRLIVKTIGVGRVVGVTDAGTGSSDDTDINVIGNDIFGSKLRMVNVAKNFRKNTGLSVPEIFRVCAENPAKAVQLEDVGTLMPGKRANFVLLNDELDLLKVVLDGEIVCDCDAK